MTALFVGRENRLTGRTEYTSRRTGITYSVGEDFDEYCSYGFNATAPNLEILSDDRREILSCIELADANTG